MPSLPASPAFDPVAGIEVREYYAAAALTGLLANYKTMTARITQEVSRKSIVAVAFLIADEMVAASSFTVPVLKANMVAGDVDRDS